MTPPAAAATFVDMLASRGIVVRAGPVRDDAPANAAEVAAVRSVPLEQIVEHMLLVSDNDAAEVLARHVAAGTGRPASFNAGSRAIVDAVGSWESTCRGRPSSTAVVSPAGTPSRRMCWWRHSRPLPAGEPGSA